MPCIDRDSNALNFDAACIDRAITRSSRSMLVVNIDVACIVGDVADIKIDVACIDFADPASKFYVLSTDRGWQRLNFDAACIDRTITRSSRSMLVVNIDVAYIVRDAADVEIDAGCIDFADAASTFAVVALIDRDHRCLHCDAGCCIERETTRSSCGFVYDCVHTLHDVRPQ